MSFHSISSASTGAAASVRYQGPDASNPTHASTSMQGGKAVFENDNFRITAHENNSSVTINNKKTGESYEISGDPHVFVDGKHAFDFYGKTTFKLEDGTKVTIDTTPYNEDTSQTLSSKVTITNGDYGVRISGVDQNNLGDMKIDEAKGYGEVLDVLESDGNTLQENPTGNGFLAVNKDGDIKPVDQKHIDQTDLKKGGAALVDKQKEAFNQLRDLISIAFQGLLSALGQGGNGNHTIHDIGQGSRHPVGHQGGNQVHGKQPYPINITINNYDYSTHNNNSNNTTTAAPPPPRHQFNPLDPIGLFD
jgi:hypothetical protein